MPVVELTRRFTTALETGKLRCRDRRYVEEPTSNIDLVKNPKVSVTPHIGAQTTEAQERVGAEVIDIVRKFFEK